MIPGSALIQPRRMPPQAIFDIDPIVSTWGPNAAIGTVASRAGYAAMQPPDADGWARTTVPIESVHHARHALLQLGPDVEVLEPAELRAAIVSDATELLRRYEGSAGGVVATDRADPSG